MLSATVPVERGKLTTGLVTAMIALGNGRGNGCQGEQSARGGMRSVDRAAMHPHPHPQYDLHIQSFRVDSEDALCHAINLNSRFRFEFYQRKGCYHPDWRA